VARAKEARGVRPIDEVEDDCREIVIASGVEEGLVGDGAGERGIGDVEGGVDGIEGRDAHGRSRTVEGSKRPDVVVRVEKCRVKGDCPWEEVGNGALEVRGGPPRVLGVPMLTVVAYVTGAAGIGLDDLIDNGGEGGAQPKGVGVGDEAVVAEGHGEAFQAGQEGRDTVSDAPARPCLASGRVQARFLHGGLCEPILPQEEVGPFDVMCHEGEEEGPPAEGERVAIESVVARPVHVRGGSNLFIFTGPGPRGCERV